MATVFGVPDRFPEIAPYDEGMLDVGDGQRVYWEVSGNPAGKPAVAVHVGPGSGSSPGRRRSFDPGAYRLVQFDPRYADPDFRMTFARLCAHYFSQGAWLGEDELLRGAGRLAGTPGVLIHGWLDLGGPADVPWLLARAWPDAELHFVGTGHAGGAEMTKCMMTALDRFART
jgi:hypothetical protein